MSNEVGWKCGNPRVLEQAYFTAKRSHITNLQRNVWVEHRRDRLVENSDAEPATVHIHDSVVKKVVEICSIIYTKSLDPKRSAGLPDSAGDLRIKCAGAKWHHYECRSRRIRVVALKTFKLLGNIVRK